MSSIPWDLTYTGKVKLAKLDDKVLRGMCGARAIDDVGKDATPEQCIKALLEWKKQAGDTREFPWDLRHVRLDAIKDLSVLRGMCGERSIEVKDAARKTTCVKALRDWRKKPEVTREIPWDLKSMGKTRLAALDVQMLRDMCRERKIEVTDGARKQTCVQALLDWKDGEAPSIAWDLNYQGAKRLGELDVVTLRDLCTKRGLEVTDGARTNTCVIALLDWKLMQEEEQDEDDDEEEENEQEQEQEKEKEKEVKPAARKKAKIDAKLTAANLTAANLTAAVKALGEKAIAQAKKLVEVTKDMPGVHVEAKNNLKLVKGFAEAAAKASDKWSKASIAAANATLLTALKCKDCLMTTAKYAKHLRSLGLDLQDQDVFHIIASENGGADHPDNYLYALGSTFNRSIGANYDELCCFLAGKAKAKKAVEISMRLGNTPRNKKKPQKKYQGTVSTVAEVEAQHLFHRGQALMYAVRAEKRRQNKSRL